MGLDIFKIWLKRVFQKDKVYGALRESLTIFFEILQKFLIKIFRMKLCPIKLLFLEKSPNIG